MDVVLWTKGYHNTHYLSPRLFKSVFKNALLEHCGIPHNLPLAVHLDFGVEKVEGIILDSRSLTVPLAITQTLKPLFDNVLLKYDVLLQVLPVAVHLADK